MAQTLQELMAALPPMDYSYKQDVFAPMRELAANQAQGPTTDLAPFFQSMLQDVNAPRQMPEVSVPGQVNPLQAFASLLGGNLASLQSGNPAFAQGPLQTLQGREAGRQEAVRTNEQMKNAAVEDQYQTARTLKLKMHEMQMMDAIKRGDMKTAAAENEARFKMLDIQRQEDARLAQESANRQALLKTQSEIDVEKVKAQGRQDTERVKGQVKEKLKADIQSLPKEAQIELAQTLNGIRSAYAAQAALGLDVDQDEMQKELEAAADKIIAKHKAVAKGETPPTKELSNADKVRARARELAAERNKK